MDPQTPASDAAAPAIEAPAPASPAPVSREDLSAVASLLADGARAFAREPAGKKAALVRSTLPRLVEIAPELAARVARARGLDPESDTAAEAWIAGPAAIIAYAQKLAGALDDIAAQGRPALTSRDLVKRRDGRLVARVVPRSWAARAARRDRETYVLFTSGCEKEDVIAGQAAFYRRRDPEGGVALVVASRTDAGAGMLDALFSLFVEGRVVVLLLPRQSTVAPLIERAFAPLIERGYLRIAQGGEDEIAELATHAAVSAVHFAGDAGAFDRLVWGPPGEARDRRRSALDPALAKPVTAALGSVGPVIVVPCLYSKEELAFIATRLASELAHGAGLDPASPRVVVISSSWPQRRLFLDLLTQRFTAIPRRADYVAAGEPEPWSIVPSLDPTSDEPLFSKTSGPAIGVVGLSSNDPEEHLTVATAFCNERLAGSLSAEIVVHPVLEEDPAIGKAVERAAIELRYGAVGINQWPALLRFDGMTPWGAHPVSTIASPRSGIGFRNDPWMLPRVDKAILRGPLRSPRAPIFFQPDHAAARAAKRMPAFEADPKLGDLVSLAGR